MAQHLKTGQLHSENILQKLVGEWFFDRKIPGHAHMKGTAIFHEINQEQVFYREEGLVISAEYSLHFF